ncbi:MAG: hypothetical protein AAF485_02810 [Chloroflexota bacterium]
MTPTNSVKFTTPRPTFAWSAASDSQSGVVSYTVVITGNGRRQTFTSLNNNLTLPSDLAIGSYYWSVQAHDASGNVCGLVTPMAHFVIEKETTNLYLPSIAKSFVTAPDLIVDTLSANSSNISITLRNQGNQAVTEAFWIDVYFGLVTPLS